jgi:hypothetical protein
MYTLIIVIGMVSSSVGGIQPGVGVTSQSVAKFKTLDECKAAASQPYAAGPVPGFSVSATWGVNWYCTYTGAN